MFKTRTLIVWLLCALCSAVVALPASEIHLSALEQLPTLFNGRIQPFERVAKTALIHIREQSSMTREHEGKTRKISASYWLWQVLCHDPIVYQEPLFLIRDSALKYAYQLSESTSTFSYEDLTPHIMDIQIQASKLADKAQKTSYDNNLLALNSKLMVFSSLLHTFMPYKDIPFNTYLTRYMERVKPGLLLFNRYNQEGRLANQKEELALIEFNQYFKQHKQFSDMSLLFLYPDLTDVANGQHWSNTGSELLKHLDYNHVSHPFLRAYGVLTLAYQTGNAAQFNSALEDILTQTDQANRVIAIKLKGEQLFHKINPLYRSITLYIVVFLGTVLFYLFGKSWLYKLTHVVFLSTFTIHSVGLLARMLIQGRPPVTNLYSSAVFIGWVAIGLSILQERWFKNKLGPLLGSMIGVATLIIAHHLSLQGDTLDQLQAVLDSNFWLSTHVITITLGIGATFLAGAIATIYVLAPFFKRAIQTSEQQLYKMVYGIICFALFFSFIGTVLGGIWGDQSWGRFWGWDPKENGALLIVIWNAIMLHARMAGMVAVRGFMLMALFGNIVSAFCWFGVNMLGVGLHSYGFMGEAFSWLILYNVSQILLLILGFNKPWSKMR